MSDPLRTIEDYELFLYSLPEQFPSIRRSTLVLARRGGHASDPTSPIQAGFSRRRFVARTFMSGRAAGEVSWTVGAMSLTDQPD